MKKTATNILLGVAIGDALGVPYEFSSREEMNPSGLPGIMFLILE